MNNSHPHPEEFILLGFADRPWLELPLFAILLITYPVAMVGNIAIILASRLDARLHSPMYFFLTNLSFLAMCYTTSTVPQMLFNLGSASKTISYLGCAAPLHFFHIMGGTECLLLAIMSFDRYVAVCKPLHYSLIMNPRICILLVCTVWLTGITYAVSEATATFQLPLCGLNKLDHLVCEIPVLIKAACGEKVANELTLSVVCIFILAVPLCLILASYACIGHAVFKIKSSEGRKKAFGTCSSHLIVVFLFYGPAISMYLQPPSSISRDQPKLMALFCGAVTPTLNPFIDTLRNKDAKGALGNLVRGHFYLQVTAGKQQTKFLNNYSRSIGFSLVIHSCVLFPQISCDIFLCCIQCNDVRQQRCLAICTTKHTMFVRMQ